MGFFPATRSGATLGEVTREQLNAFRSHSTKNSQRAASYAKGGVHIYALARQVEHDRPLIGLRGLALSKGEQTARLILTFPPKTMRKNYRGRRRGIY